MCPLFVVGINFGPDNQFIENASTLWDEADFPFAKVAKISIPTPQPDVDSEQNLAHCEQMAFSSWHSLVEHKPIGSINRLHIQNFAVKQRCRYFRAYNAQSGHLN